MSAASSVNSVSAKQLTSNALGQSFLEFSDGLTFHSRAKIYLEKGIIPPMAVQILVSWYDSYTSATKRSVFLQSRGPDYTERAFSTLLELIKRNIDNPIEFMPYHQSIRSPYDYYHFGLDFSMVLVDVAKSDVQGQKNIQRAMNQLREGDNVIFLSNHQSEGDPYAIDGLLSFVCGCPRDFCRDMIFMAGDRVREDVVVAPFSAGRNLLTVYSKKHLDDVPELRASKVTHNRRTISVTQKLFREGGKCIWFAPSGGRDRRSQNTGKVEVSDFDSGAIEMMRFTANKAGRPCHFYPMSIVTYNMLPPPSRVGGAQIGEERVVNFIPMFMAVGEEIDWSKAVPSNVTDKEEKRIRQGAYIQDIVVQGYRNLGGYEL